MRNIFDREYFVDKRGFIVDILYNTKINHVALIKSNKKSIRGNHFHKKTIQYTYVLDGKLYYFKKKGRSYHKKILKKGDLIKTMPLEIHAFKFLAKKNTLLIFSSGLRGGKDYEKDTFRVESIVK
jgi:quercetin dioxygenase-like cupin family protein